MKDSKELMADFAGLETTYWFYAARLDILRRLFEGLIEPGSLIANIGCGPGATSRLAADFGDVISVDYSLDALHFTAERGIKNLASADCTALPLAAEACDIALCLDVMEHIDDHRAFADELFRILAPGGKLVVTVPAGMWQWTRRDTVFGHYRRYSARSLGRVLAGAGFSLELTTHFNSLLFPLNALDVLVDRFRKNVSEENCYPRFNPVLNGILRSVFSLEKFFIPRPGFPFGRSLLAVAVRV
ncbi:MAG: class I SAM-dependent methyltransferase [Candidatus Glassbacteria bacterium]|nr:class I SAM-dependent methyltransferase [Candidatus Glassbacteria bacterium]